ncbi:hypothetical protein BDV23DRAFT_183668 [Aspergillus alliaceus]|uniref:Uncharacterized protein n=1 Tax=Petromyces alliaceus TaxID=209559 RepID=A0A5N7C7Q7_PETAA|nr:hypothetical protein BDV23DRAFT_183668 [Aspergillus alliaceus]
MPNLSREALRKIASITPATKEALERIIELKRASRKRKVIAAIAKAMERRLIEPENTRVRRKAIYEVLQAFVKAGVSTSHELDAGAILHSSFNYHGQY